LSIPPIESLFFDLQNDRELFLEYLTFLRGLPAGIVLGTYRDLIKSLNSICIGDKIPIVMLTSVLTIDESEIMREFVMDQVFKPTTHFDIFIIQPPVYPPDFGPLSDLTLFLNVRLNFCDLSQYSMLPDEIIQSLFDLKFIDVIIYCLLPPSLKIADILGPGIRRGEKQFALTSMSIGDSVYFYFDYTLTTLKFLAPAAQFQIRYFDSLGRRVIRQMTATFSLVDNMYTCAINVNYDIHIAGTAIKVIEKNRLSGTIEAVHTALHAAKLGFIDDTFAKLFLLQIEKHIREKLEYAFGKGQRLLSKAMLSQVMGRNPEDIVNFLVPVGYRFQIDSTEMEGPMLLNGRPIEVGAYYIAMPGKHGVVLLAAGEDVGVWSIAVNESPLRELIATVCRETVIEILAPSTSAAHPLFVHIQKCIAD
jgi:hypothetical protein